MKTGWIWGVGLSISLVIVIWMSLKTLEEVRWGSNPEFIVTDFLPENGFPHLLKYETRCRFEADSQIVLHFDEPPDCYNWDVQVWDRFGNLVEVFSNREIIIPRGPFELCIGRETDCSIKFQLDFIGRGWLIVRFFSPRHNSRPNVTISRVTD